MAKAKGRKNSGKGRKGSGTKSNTPAKTNASKNNTTKRNSTPKIFGQGVQPVAIGGAAAGALLIEAGIERSLSSELVESVPYRAAKVILPGGIGYGIYKAKLFKQKTGRAFAQGGLMLSLFFAAKELAKKFGFEFNFGTMFGKSAAQKKATIEAQDTMGRLIDEGLNQFTNNKTASGQRLARSISFAAT